MKTRLLTRAFAIILEYLVIPQSQGCCLDPVNMAEHLFYTFLSFTFAGQLCTHEMAAVGFFLPDEKFQQFKSHRAVFGSSG